MLLFFASLGYVPVFFCFPSFVTRSNLSSFATGSSLRAESPLSVVSCILSHGFASCPLLLVSFLICSDFSPSFSSLCLGGSSLRFLFPLVAGWHSRLHLFCLSSSFLRLSPLRGFPSSFLLQLLFSLVLFPSSCCSGKFSRLLPQVSSFGSSAPLRPLRLASSSIPYGPLCPGDTVACPLPYRLLCIDPVVMVLVHSLPYRMLFLW